MAKKNQVVCTQSYCCILSTAAKQKMLFCNLSQTLTIILLRQKKFFTYIRCLKKRDMKKLTKEDIQAAIAEAQIQFVELNPSNEEDNFF